MNVLEEIRNDITGASALADWLGGEPPVDLEQALNRSLLCVGGDKGFICPLNVEPNWWEKAIKEPAAAWITRELQEKHAMKLTTPYDAKLGMCRACGCAISLKVWTPAAVLKRHVTQNQINKTPAFCWMRKLS